jgi:hypothetical protein
MPDEESPLKDFLDFLLFVAVLAIIVLACAAAQS